MEEARSDSWPLIVPDRPVEITETDGNGSPGRFWLRKPAEEVATSVWRKASIQDGKILSRPSVWSGKTFYRKKKCKGSVNPHWKDRWDGGPKARSL